MQTNDDKPTASQGLRLQKAFGRITDNARRRLVIELAEQLADVDELRHGLAEKAKPRTII